MTAEQVERLAKLPKWAVDEITTLRAQVLALDAALAQCQRGTATRIRIRDDDRTSYLPERAVLQFNLGTQDHRQDFDLRLRQETRDGPYHIEVSGCAQRLKIMPRAANAAWLGADET